MKPFVNCNSLTLHTHHSSHHFICSESPKWIENRRLRLAIGLGFRVDDIVIGIEIFEFRYSRASSGSIWM
ncbi:hypothetical protein RchiOBHm_Chr5g0070871 [Rosa chinensis]|uniref:Uncharacterized protein n=1 Tax=Rosa chinensis TaxID=74649 RepID=A0A2P6QK96_ROSCH|nr:hypothetical protein RchiOBHm_Chr5g0070871 [Rosa chinensis]